MSAQPSKPTQPTPTTFNERLNEQLINCLNVQTNVIQNLAQYSQHISLQLLEIKSVVEILSNRVLALQQQQQQTHYAPSHYAASYYPNYMSHPPPIPVSHQPPPPPSSSYPSHPMPPNMPPQQPSQMRQPHLGGMTAPAVTTANAPFFPTHAAPPPPPSQTSSLSSNVPSFQFGTSSAAPPPQTASTTITTTTTVPSITTTASSKPFFSSPSKFGTGETTTAITTTTKPSILFGTTTTTSTTTTSNAKPTASSMFQFGTSNTTTGFNLGALVSNTPITQAPKVETNADDDGEGGGEDDSYEPEVSFKPIVELKAVEVKTGEEDENVLFCERAKLYRFDAASNQMKERGTGEMKILQHKTSNVCRVLMRREQVLKLCANHTISAQMELKPHQGSNNAYLWSAMDFADGEAKHETLCVKFKTEEQAKKFAKVFNEAKAINTKKSGEVLSTEKPTPKKDETKTKPTTNDDDVIPLSEVKPSAEQIDRAKQLQLPSTFYLYENKEPCKGCPGCEEDTPPAVANENKTATKKPTDTVKNDAKTTVPPSPSTTSGPKTPLGSSENTKFSFGGADKTPTPFQKQTSNKEEKTSNEPSTPNAASQYDSKPSIFGNPNGTASTSIFGGTTPLTNGGGSVFGSTSSFKTSTNTANSGFSFPGFGGGGAPASSTPTAGFQFSTPGASSAAPPTSTTNSSSTFSFGTSSSQPVFGNAPKFSFADLAKQSPSSGNDKTNGSGSDQRVFAGQGSLIFGTNSANTTTTGNQHEDDDGEGGGDDESYEPNVSFKPIVQLSAVDVKTGEEDENVLFCERAKLYRFDADSNQMKERGVGEMKILQHKTSNLCRIVMRREQVLKLCANHAITSQMEMKPHQGSENAYVWSAMDFAEGEARHETLCVRFKSTEQAKKFMKEFNEAKQKNANAQQ